MYYLAYMDGSNYVKLDIPKPGRSIADIATYTLNFKSEEDLLLELYNNKQIPNLQTKVFYLSSRKYKGRLIEKVISEGRVYTLKQKVFFISKYMKSYIDTVKYDPEFMTYLYCEYLINSGAIGYMKNYLASLNNDPKKLTLTLKDIATLPLSNDLVNCLNKLLLSIGTNTQENALSSFLKQIEFNQYDTVNIFKKLRGKFDYVKLPALRPLEKLHSISVTAYNMGVKNYEQDRDMYENPETYIREFINKVIYAYDYKENKFITNSDGNRKINKKELFDLGVLLEYYYSKSLELNRNIVEEEEEEEYDKEEFLEDEDYIRFGLDPEEHRIRK